MKYMCEMERRAGERAHKKFFLCEGFYRSSGVRFYDEYYGYQQCAECKECKRYIHRKLYVNLFYAFAVSLSILAILILGTPQGAIRRSLFFTEGMQEAFFSNVERTEKEDDTENWYYSVVVNGEKQEWVVFPWHSICVAWQLTE